MIHYHFLWEYEVKDLLIIDFRVIEIWKQNLLLK